MMISLRGQTWTQSQALNACVGPKPTLTWPSSCLYPKCYMPGHQETGNLSVLWCWQCSPALSSCSFCSSPGNASPTPQIWPGLQGFCRFPFNVTAAVLEVGLYPRFWAGRDALGHPSMANREFGNCQLRQKKSKRHSRRVCSPGTATVLADFHASSDKYTNPLDN